MDVSHPREIASAVSDEEADRLTELALGMVVLEVGADFGFSTIVLARVAQQLHSVDWFRGDPHAGHKDTFVEFWQNLQRHGVREKVIVHIGDAAVVVPQLPDALFDMAFIDAFHEEDAVYADAMRVLPKMKPRAVIAFHDWGVPHFGVTQAVERFCSEMDATMDSVRTLAVVTLR